MITKEQAQEQLLGMTCPCDECARKEDALRAVIALRDRVDRLEELRAHIEAGPLLGATMGSWIKTAMKHATLLKETTHD